MLQTSQTTERTPDEEWQIRCDLAAVFRVLARLDMNEHIGNHLSAMLPGSAQLFLINPRGWHFREITASRLLLCDLEGRVVKGQGELRKVAFHIHARIHLRHPSARCVLHAHPRYLTALSMAEEGRLALAHQNSLTINDRVAYDDAHNGVVSSNQEGDRIAEALGDKTLLLMGNHGVTVVGPTVHEAFDELYLTERTCMYQMTALAAGMKLRLLDDGLRYRHHGPWGERFDARMHLDAWRRILDREEADYAS